VRLQDKSAQATVTQTGSHQLTQSLSTYSFSNLEKFRWNQI